MRNLPKRRLLTRRKFLQRSARGVGLLGLAAAAGSIARAATPKAADKRANPYAYDLSRYKKTDPKLIHYEETGRISCPHDEPRRIATGPSDRLYVAAGSYVTELDHAGNRGLEIALDAPARCVAVAADGTIYVGLRDHIEVFDRKGQRQAAWESPGKRTWFTGLAVGDAELFATDAGHRLVLRYERSGKLLARLGQKDKERNIPGFIVPSPFFDVKLARDGLLRVANPGRHRVEAYTVEGDFEFAWGRASAAIDGFCGCCNPVSLAQLPDDRFVTCEKGLPRVKVYSADGAFESVVAGPESFAENAKVCGADDFDCNKGGLDAVVDSQGRIYILDLVAGDIRIMARKSNA